MPIDSVSRSVAVLGRATFPRTAATFSTALLSPATNSTSNRFSWVSAPTGYGAPPRSIVYPRQALAEIEELSGRSYDRFFDQWLYHAHNPELDVNYSWDEKTKLAKLSIRQTQKLGENVLLFALPLNVRFEGGFGAADRPIHVKEKAEDFYFPLDSAPTAVRVDPELTLLAKISFTLPNAMLFTQLTNRTDVVGRLLAIEQLSARTDKEAVKRLKERLNDDPFFGVRLESSRALRTIHTDDAFDALLASTKQPDARVRRQVTDDIGAFYREPAYSFACSTLTNEHNPAIVSEAINSLAGYSKSGVREALIRFLNSDSYRNELAVAAIGAQELKLPAKPDDSLRTITQDLEDRHKKRKRNPIQGGNHEV